MFKDADGHISSTKIYTFFGYFSFLLVSFYVLYAAPEKFNYELFSILAGGGAVGTRILDKAINVYANKTRIKSCERSSEEE